MLQDFRSSWIHHIGPKIPSLFWQFLGKCTGPIKPILAQIWHFGVKGTIGISVKFWVKWALLVFWCRDSHVEIAHEKILLNAILTQCQDTVKKHVNPNLALIGKLTEENNPINVILSRKMLNRMNPIRCQIFEDVLFIWPSKSIFLLWNCDDIGKNDRFLSKPSKKFNTLMIYR